MAQTGEPAEAGIFQILACREQQIGGAIVVQIFAMNCILNDDGTLACAQYSQIGR
jgi:hypothetical protein